MRSMFRWELAKWCKQKQGLAEQYVFGMPDRFPQFRLADILFGPAIEWAHCQIRAVARTDFCFAGSRAAVWAEDIQGLEFGAMAASPTRRMEAINDSPAWQGMRAI